MSGRRWLFWAAFWLALLLVAIKASYLGVPPLTANDLRSYFRSLAAISYRDVFFVSVTWACARLILGATGGERWSAGLASGFFLCFAAISAVYAIVNVVIFGVFGGFLTYALIELVGNVRMLSSSVAAYVTPRIVAGLIGLPLFYVMLVWASVRFGPHAPRAWRRLGQVAAACLLAWLAFGYYAYAASWTTRQDRRIAEDSHWVLLSSWWQAMTGAGTARMPDTFAPADLLDFQTERTAPARAPSRRPPNVILVVLEAVAARWASLNGGLYHDTTPVLAAEAAHGIVFENAYAHIGRSSDSLAAILMSVYPKLDFRDITEEYPTLPGTSLASVFHDRGYRTAFYEPSDLAWAGWNTFLSNRGFDELHDYHSLPCPELISSWGVEDRCMVDGMLEFIKHDPSRPFFLMGWTVQTHHPYEPTPAVPLLDLLKGEPGPDSYELGRYLNVLHETDRHLGRLLDGIRSAGLGDDTLVVFVGDHGQAFGYPHDSYMQGRTTYEEDVHVPLLMWFPGVYHSAARSKTIGGHVDLAPTIAALAGVPASPDWEGHNLLDPGHMPRAYFFVAEDHFKLAVREDQWKYIFDLREGVEELYDLSRDPDEQHNIASAEPQRCARLRQRLAAWTEANRRQYQRQ